MYKKGQTWSFDLIVAVVLFIVVVGLFYGYIVKNRQSNEDILLEGSKLLAYKVNCDNKGSSDLCFVNDGHVNATKINEFYNYDYEYVKENLKSDKDFCIYLLDQNGNLVPVDQYTGLGSDILILTESGLVCGEDLRNTGGGNLIPEID